MTKSSSPVHVFISYSREDTDLLERLRKQFMAIERSGLVDTWYDGEIEAGSQWGQVTKNALHRAEVILLLISADFIACDQCYDKEMENALDMHKKGEAIVIPVILRDCTWQFTPFAQLQCLPKNGIPVTDRDHWHSPDKALKEVVDEVAAICIQLRNPQHPDLKIEPKKIEQGAATGTRASSTGNGGRSPSSSLKWLAAGGGALLLIALLFFFSKSNDKKMPQQTQVERVETTPSQSTSNKTSSTNNRQEEGTDKSPLETRRDRINEAKGRVDEAKSTIANTRKAKFTDSRDGQTYRTLSIGGISWMVDNLRYQPDFGNSWCYDNNTGNCDQYGRLYDFKTAKQVCPEGWRLPSESEWRVLAGRFGGAAIQELNKVGLSAYASMIVGGESGFEARLGGYYDGKLMRFTRKGEIGRYWTSTSSGSDNARFYEFRLKEKKLKRERHYQAHGMSCRCVSNSN
ncbi:MAG: FISUMP domain-containing protein [Bacteroidota bacterium]